MALRFTTSQDPSSRLFSRKLSADNWDTQMLFFLKHGYRVVSHERNGRPSQTADGHDMDRYADDPVTTSKGL
jgi:hypothetical protein